MPSFGDIMTGLFTLIMVLLVFYAAYAVSKWLSSKTHFSGGKRMKILETIPLGRERYIMLVEAGAKVLVIGVSGQSIRTLSTLKPEEVKELEPVSGQNGQSFQNIFSDMMGKKISGLWKKPSGKGDNE